MDTILWILLCFFAAVGMVQLVGWALYTSLRPNKGTEGYCVAPLSADPGQLESQIRYYLTRRSWGVSPGMILFVPEASLGSEGEAICRRMLEGASGVMLCHPWELESTIRGFLRAHEAVKGT